MAEKKTSDLRQLKQIGVLTTVPVILLAGPVAGYFIGDWLDHRFRFYPWCTILLILAGFAASIREMSRLLKQLLKEDEKNKTA